MALRAGKLTEARDLFAKLAARTDQSEVLLELLADLALETKDLSDLVHWEDELQKQEGPDGTGWRFYRAQRLLSQASGAADIRLSEVEQLTTDIIELRPMWSIGSVLQGQLAERRGQPERAIEAYRKAIDLGEQRTFVREQMVALLYATGQAEEVEKYLELLGDAVARSPRLTNIAISLRIRGGDSAMAVQLARSEVERRPQDPLSHVALGQALLAAEEKSEAEESFRRATTLGPEELRSWQALFGFYVANGQKDKARNTLAEVAKNVKHAEKDLLPVLAQDQLLMGDAEAAAQSYRKLLEVAPDDASVQGRVAAFFADRDPALAERCYRRAMELEPQARGQRLALASYLISRGGDTQFAEAGQLLDASSTGVKIDPLTQSLRARLLLRRGHADDHRAARSC